MSGHETKTERWRDVVRVFEKVASLVTESNLPGRGLHAVFEEARKFWSRRRRRRARETASSCKLAKAAQRSGDTLIVFVVLLHQAFEELRWAAQAHRARRVGQGARALRGSGLPVGVVRAARLVPSRTGVRPTFDCIPYLVSLHADKVGRADTRTGRTASPLSTPHFRYIQSQPSARAAAAAAQLCGTSVHS
jgi:hypothetical protein